jgi:hypothetical protein
VLSPLDSWKLLADRGHGVADVGDVGDVEEGKEVADADDQQVDTRQRPTGIRS